MCEKSVCLDQVSSGGAVDPSLVEDMQDAAFAILQIVSVLAHSDNSFVPTNALFDTDPPVPGSPSADLFGLGNNLNRWLFLQALQAKAGGVWTGLLSLVHGGVPAQASDMPMQTLHAMHSIVDSSTSPIANVMTLDDSDKQNLRAALHAVALVVYRDVKKSDLQSMEAIVTVSVAIVDPVVAALTALINGLFGNVAQSAITEVAAEIGLAAVDARFGLDKLDDQGLIGQIAAFSDAYADWQNANADLRNQAQAVAQALDTLANTRNDDIRSAYPLSAVAEAREREEALIMHLNDYNNFYTFSVYQALLTSGAAIIPSLVRSSNGLISQNPIGVVNGKLAFPVDLNGAAAADPSTLSALADWFNALIRDNKDLDDGPKPSVLSLPTPAVMLKTRLEICNACEEFIEESRNADLHKRRAEARRIEVEAQRLELRLKQDPPDLSDPTAQRYEPRLAVKVTQETPPKCLKVEFPRPWSPCSRHFGGIVCPLHRC